MRTFLTNMIISSLASPSSYVSKPRSTSNIFSFFFLIGGGTAGCVLANRLSQSPDITVLLVERGPLAESWASRVPLLSSDFASDGSRTQMRMSEHQSEIGRAINLCTGSALGGSSRVNQMIYLRGLKKEYDMWKDKTGCKGWGWDDVSTTFKKSERALGDGNECVDEDVHGTTGVCVCALDTRVVFLQYSHPGITLGEWCNRGDANLYFPGFNK